MYNKFKAESENNERDIIIQLMNYYQAPYMAVLIRCYELGLPDSNCISEDLLKTGKSSIKKRLVDLWLDDSILDATKRDDYAHMESLVMKLGNECISESYLNERTLQKVLHNMKILYSKLKEE